MRGYLTSFEEAALEACKEWTINNHYDNELLNIKSASKSGSKYPLTKKDKKRRAKNKRAKKARKINRK